MAYFKLQLTGTDDRPLLDSDLDVAEFEPLAGNIVALLVRQRVLPADGKVEVRIIPRADDSPNFQRPVVLGVTGMGECREGLEILFEKAQPPIEQVAYWTLQLRSAETKSIYRIDFPLGALLGSVLTAAGQALLDQNVLASGEHFRFRVSACEGTPAKVDPLLAATTKPEEAAVPASQPDRCRARPPRQPAAASASPAPPQDDLEIVIGPVEELVKPQPKPMKAYGDAEAVGQIVEQDVPIFMRRGAIEQARHSAGRSAKSDEEIGGFLLGNVFRDPDTLRLFVEISEVVEADRARGTYVSLDFNYDAWRQVLDRIDQDFPDKFLVGWYHTHLVSMTSVRPVENAENEYEARYVTFFSHADLFIHQNFFPDPWHVALVLDLRCKNEVFFAWQEGHIASTQGFFLYGP